MTDRPTAPLAALTLVASLRAALATARFVEDRRSGYDQVLETARGAEEALVVVRRRLQSALSLLRVRLALGAPSEEAAALVQAFRDRLFAADVAADLAEVHRLLLTLYPAVEAELVEAARLAGAEADRVAGAVDFDAVAPALAAVLDELAEALQGAF